MVVNNFRFCLFIVKLRLLSKVLIVRINSFVLGEEFMRRGKMKDIFIFCCLVRYCDVRNVVLNIEMKLINDKWLRNVVVIILLERDKFVVRDCKMMFKGKVL